MGISLYRSCRERSFQLSHADNIFMVNINLNKLNELELKIHSTIKQALSDESLSINEAAELCGCSISKISKFVKKLGFPNYKQYIQYMLGREIAEPQPQAEFDRIRMFMEQFDSGIVDYFIDLFDRFSRIVLLGYGSTFYALLYWEYKLRVINNKNVFAVQDNQTAQNMLDANTLLLCFSVSGKFMSFEDVYSTAMERNAYVAVVLEEYNPDILGKYSNIVSLTRTTQPYPWKFYEKSRILFFILIEEIMNKIVAKQYENENSIDVPEPDKENSIY